MHMCGHMWALCGHVSACKYMCGHADTYGSSGIPSHCVHVYVSSCACAHVWYVCVGLQLCLYIPYVPIFHVHVHMSICEFIGVSAGVTTYIHEQGTYGFIAVQAHMSTCVGVHVSISMPIDICVYVSSCEHMSE